MLDDENIQRGDLSPSARGAWSPGSANFAVIKEWNKADVYARMIAYFAKRLARGE